MNAQYVLGIDLGTTNSVLAYAPLDDDEPQIQLLMIPQLVERGDDRTTHNFAGIHLFGPRA